MARPQECPCGSGEWPDEVTDARGIFVCYCCDHCRAEMLEGYRPEIWTDPNYETTEDVEPQD